MRKLMMLAVAGVLFCGLALVKADDKGTKITIEGDGMCAKCALKETKTCQNVVIVTKDGKKTTYYLVHEGVSKKSHGSLGFCQASKDSRWRSRSPARARPRVRPNQDRSTAWPQSCQYSA